MRGFEQHTMRLGKDVIVRLYVVMNERGDIVSAVPYEAVVDSRIIHTLHRPDWFLMAATIALNTLNERGIESCATAHV